MVLARAANQKPGETRLDLTYENAAIWCQTIPELVKHNRSTILPIATNPGGCFHLRSLEVVKSADPSTHRVIGSGTILDTARFRYLLTQQFGVDARSACLHHRRTWRQRTAGVVAGPYRWHASEGIRRGARPSPRSRDHGRYFRQTRDAAYRLIERKGATYHAVAAGLMRITQAILRNRTPCFRSPA